MDSIAVEGETATYGRSERIMDFHRCATCGAVMHRNSVRPPGAGRQGRRAVNMRLAIPRPVAGLPVRRFDGAGTWRPLAPGEQAETPFLSL